MISQVTRHILNFILLLLLQVLVLNNIDLGYFFNPYVFPMFLLILPVQLPYTVSLITAFLAGLVLDMFCNSAGIHAATMVILAFLRPSVLSIVTPRGGYDTLDRLSVYSFGWMLFTTYVGISLFIYHFFYFLFEFFSFKSFFTLLGKTILSSIIAVFLSIILSAIFSPLRKRA